jgi:pyruvate dehydrogenase E2 component (dihydrolipoamide acetyltransferase)
MVNEVIIPAFGTSDEDVKFIKWLKNVGDTIKKGDLLCELETDKATTELESFFDGVLLKQLVEADSEIAIGTVIAHIGDE